MMRLGNRPAVLRPFGAIKPVRHLAPRHPACRRTVAMASSSSSPELWALDFDGVVCDSCGESSISAWKVSWGGEAVGRRGANVLVVSDDRYASPAAGR